MNKQELIHLHGLLAEVSNHFEERTEEPLDLDEYERMDVRPTSIQKPKTEHEDAIFALASGITGTIEDEDMVQDMEAANEVYNVEQSAGEEIYAENVVETGDYLMDNYDKRDIYSAVYGLHENQKPLQISRNLDDDAHVGDVDAIRGRLEENGLYDGKSVSLDLLEYIDRSVKEQSADQPRR